MVSKVANKEIQKILDEVNKKYTDPKSRPIVSRGGGVEEIKYIPASSYAINQLLGGGWYEGKLHEFFSAEHGGKSSLAILALQDCLKHYNNERPVIYVDIEHRFNKKWAEKLGMVVDEDIILVQPPDAEAATDILADLIRTGHFSAFVWDSIGASVSTDVQAKFDDKKRLFGGSAAVITRMVHTIVPLMSLYRVTGFVCNQLRADMEGYNRPMTPGGKALKHGLSARIYLRKGKDKYISKKATGPEQVGFAMIMKLIKGFEPTPREQYSDFFYEESDEWFDGIGFDTNKELQRLGIQIGVIKQTSSWFEYEGVKKNGRDPFFAALEAEGLRDKLAAEVMASLSKTTHVEFEGDLAKPETDQIDIEDPEV